MFATLKRDSSVIQIVEESDFSRDYEDFAENSLISISQIRFAKFGTTTAFHLFRDSEQETNSNRKPEGRDCHEHEIERNYADGNLWSGPCLDECIGQ